MSPTPKPSTKRRASLLVVPVADGAETMLEGKPRFFFKVLQSTLLLFRTFSHLLTLHTVTARRRTYRATSAALRVPELPLLPCRYRRLLRA